MTRSNREIRAHLRRELADHWWRIHGPVLRQVERDAARRAEPVLGDGDNTSHLAAVALVDALLEAAGQRLERIANLNELQTNFVERYAAAETSQSRRRLVMEFSAGMGAGRRQLLGDWLAFRRWFGRDAILERFRDTLGECEWHLKVCLERLGVALACAMETAGEATEPEALWRRLGFEPLLTQLMAYIGDVRIRAVAIQALARSLRDVPQHVQERMIGETALRAIYRFAMDRRQDVWVQCAAIDALATHNTGHFERVVENRLAQPGEGDDCFVRANAIRAARKALPHSAATIQHLCNASQDSSALVRQSLLEVASELPEELRWMVLAQLCLADKQRAVRSAGVLTLAKMASDSAAFEQALGLSGRVFIQERDAFVLRAALHAFANAIDDIAAQDESRAATYYESLIPHVERLHCVTADEAVRRQAALCRERLWSAGEARLRRARDDLAGILDTLKEGRGRRLPKKLTRALSQDELGRMLSVLAQNGFGLELYRGARGTVLYKGDRMRFRFWRFLHELRHPASDKRQGFAHMIGRVYYGRIQAPSAILGEISRTKVPGEPFVDETEQSWRPFLPLVDQVLSSVDSGGRTRIYTAEGVTEIESPKGVIRRMATRIRLSLRFAKLARLRNWGASDSFGPDAYSRACHSAGVKLSLHPHAGARGAASVDPAVKRFFSVGLPIPLIPAESLQNFQNYAYSVYQNTLSDIVIFLAGAASVFLGQHIWIAQRMRIARRLLPLVIGGWGTRGKSGTERLKAALFNALGHAVLSKTTGCEAMIVSCRPFRPLSELFLFRPYDKATIWEQVQVCLLGARMKAQVFLWECMGLSPDYVGILQKQWMRDDISTITNAYPDHEDLQGPAGRDIPRVMARFIPARATVITAEQQMLPVLQDCARRRHARLLHVNWLDEGLLPPDALARFPYEEHPANVALVLRLAQELGIERDFALKEMADRVVPDLGVLKAFPVAHVEGRRLEFVNGMSANERFACLGNWRRMGFADHDYVGDPGTWIGTVVNNRADREPRSKVFASILAKDLSADVHVIIGTNTKGMKGYLREAWEERLQQLSLFQGDAETARDTFTKWARWLRIPMTRAQIVDQARTMLVGVGVERGTTAETLLQSLGHSLDAHEFERCLEEQSVPYAREIAVHLDRQAQRFAAYRSLHDRLGQGAERDGLEQEARELLRLWFFERIVVIEDSHASGDEIVTRIVELTPPGMHHRFMGIQNIKGTGLDFAYRFVAWDQCNAALERLRSDDEAIARQGLRDIVAFREFGPLCSEAVRETIAGVRDKPFAQSDAFQAQLDTVSTTLDEALAGQDSRGARAHGGALRGPLRGVAHGVEQFLDAGDAIKRRKRAERIYRDLAAQRISVERAAAELRGVTYRQKGGWFIKKLHSMGVNI